MKKKIVALTLAVALVSSGLMQTVKAVGTNDLVYTTQSVKELIVNVCAPIETGGCVVTGQKFPLRNL